MTTADALDRGREAFRRKAWADACAHLLAADRERALAPQDLERIATAAFLLGDDEGSAAAWERVHREYLEMDDLPGAARGAFWLGFGLMQVGESARGGGWIGRAGRLLEEGECDCVESGYLLLPVGLRCLAQGDHGGATDAFVQVEGTGEHFGDTDLITLGRLGQGQCLIRTGEIEQGVGLLDEVMVAVDIEETSPIVVGIVYCAAIEACNEIYDVARAQEWTGVLSRWCDSQPDLVPYRGQCLVRRAEIMQLKGAWPDALQESQRACERLSRPEPGRPAAGAAFYQRAELHRLRGEFAEAEAAYREASQRGRKPQPGLAQLRRAEGRIDAARTAITRVLDEARETRSRSRILPAYIEIMLAADDLPAARTAVDELVEVSRALGAPLIRAIAERARGAVLLAEGDSRSALDALRNSSAGWDELDAPYDAACVRVLIARACRELGDDDTADMEFEAARSTFRKLGAEPDLERLHALTRGAASAGTGPEHGLTRRELEVLSQVATGRTNRAIAGELFISERTVERHVSNIFRKLSVSSRAEATAYAYEHQLI